MTHDRHAPLSDDAIDQIFRTARTFSKWLPKPVSENLLRELYGLARLGPTSANGSPARFVFITSAEAKEKLLGAMAPGNVEKTRAAPVTALIAYDTAFYELFPRLFPYVPMRDNFANNPAMATDNAVKNSWMQGGYFIVAARSLGLDCGPMLGFNADKVNELFFPDGKWKVNFVCNLGYGDTEGQFPRGPRLDFDEACKIV